MVSAKMGFHNLIGCLMVFSSSDITTTTQAHHVGVLDEAPHSETMKRSEERGSRVTPPGES